MAIITKKKTTAPDPRKPLHDALVAYEAAAEVLGGFREKHELTFATLELLVARQGDAERLVKLEAGKTAANQAINGIIASGKAWNVRVTQKHRAAYYNPALLPADVLRRPGVITAVDTKAVADLGDPRTQAAWTAGDAMTPAVSIQRTKGAT